MEKATTNYERATKICSDNPIAKNNLAYLYANHRGNLDVPLKLAEEA